MAKVKTIQEKKEQMVFELARLNAFEKILNTLENTLHWDYCNIKCDDEGDSIKDDEGNYIFEEPCKDSYYYSEYMAFKSAVDEIKGLI